MKKSKYLNGFIFSVIITTLIISSFTITSGVKQNIKELKNFSIKFAFFSMFIIILKWFVETLILKLSLFDERKKISFFKLFKIIILGQFFSYLTPFYTGGQPLQVYYLSKEKINPSVATASILYKSMFFQIVMVLMGFIGLQYSSHLNNYIFIILISGILLNGFVVFLILFFSLNKELSKKTVKKTTLFLKKIKILKNPQKHMEEIMNKVEEFVNFFKKNSKNYVSLFSIFILSIIQLLLYVFTSMIILNGFGIKLNLDLFFRSLILDVGSSVVPTPGTSGGAEGFYYLIFSNKASIYVLNTSVLIWRLSTYYFVLFIGSLFFLISKKNRRST
ncbi:phosphatidylglycerol lysyltransferase [Tepiditoga spiralis]|uniref:Phosphatidylglycerol lysyltransferase n=1 Tax=Tepiditoga spiralis TaxID=2108365 RepID=A0A7G1GA95_9BACT|nr:lysylphosphatidylglycerol synthase transmembrane domain-containing protein [Tepiditoga spiralis]BBE31997.1 phosphatidylglycerol lysyltransferase [Tepiditoga spiralis]